MGKPLEAAAGPAAPSGAPTASPRYFAPADHIAPSPEASRLAGAPAAASVAPALSPALGRARTRQHAAGVAGFGLLLFAAGAAPGALPAVFLAFVLTALPWRCADFVKRRWTFFLIDFCYFVNLAAALFLLFAPDSPEAEALVYALSDGPLAGALVAWQCAWVFGDSEHTVSVLMHLLPGLAVFAHRYHTPPAMRGWRGLLHCARGAAAGRAAAACGAGAAAPAVAQPHSLWAWIVVAPLAFYLAWQLLYFVVVQVLLRGFIKREGYDTSYNCLARRAAKSNNFWNRLVRRGSIARRISMYGLLQLAFTAIALAAFLPTYFSYGLALAYQVVKFWFPIYYGSRMQCEKLPQRLLRQAMGITASGAKRLHHGGGSAAGGGHGLARAGSLQRALSMQRRASAAAAASGGGGDGRGEGHKDGAHAEENGWHRAGDDSSAAANGLRQRPRGGGAMAGAAS